MAASFQDLIYEYMTRPPLRLKNQTELRLRVNVYVEPYGHEAGRSAFNAWLTRARRPPSWFVPALVGVLGLDETEELSLYRSL